MAIVRLPFRAVTLAVAKCHPFCEEQGVPVGFCLYAHEESQRQLEAAITSRLDELCEKPTPFLARRPREICGELEDGA